MESRLSLPSPRMTRPELAVFVSGVAGMGLEILAGRIIAPEFGSSIYTWGSIIGVFLAALSLGYHRGGKQAATRASNQRLVRIFLATALYVAGLILFGDLLLQSAATLPLPNRFASIPGITLLFGPPTYLLGYVSPYAAELSRRSEVGAASGHVYALGTVGSIVGAFATTFLLIPSLSVTEIGLVFGFLSVGTAVALARPNLGREEAARSVVVAVVLLVAASTGSIGLGVGGNVVYQTQTAYQELRVTDSDGVRTLYLDGQPHSAMDLDDPTRHVFDYTSYFHAPLLLSEDIDRVLFVGGGGFTGPRTFLATYPNVTVDVVEIDPEVVDVATQYFRVNESERLNVHTMGVTREELRARNRERDIGIDLAPELTSYRNSEPTDDVPVLRDGRAPVDSLLDPMVGQRYVIERTNETETKGNEANGSETRTTVGRSDSGGSL